MKRTSSRPRAADAYQARNRRLNEGAVDFGPVWFGPVGFSGDVVGLPRMRASNDVAIKTKLTSLSITDFDAYCQPMMACPVS